MAKSAARASHGFFRQIVRASGGACLASSKVVDAVEPNARAQLLARALVTGDVDAPLALCTERGEVESATPGALELLRRLCVLEHVPASLPDSLWSLLEAARVGEAIEWQAAGERQNTLGCTRYRLRDGGFLLLMREVSEKQAALSEHLNQQRFESTGRLIASVAHDVRSSVASIVYSADFLDRRATSIRQDTLRETVHDICDASRRLSLTVDALLDYARLGPAISVPVSLREVLNRAQGLLRSYFRDGAHRLRVEVSPDADWLRGNPVIMEQIMVNVLLSAAECAEDARLVSVSSELSLDVAHKPCPHVLVRVSMHGADSAERAFSRVSAATLTREHGVALALADARSACEGQGGSFRCQRTKTGACFELRLPRSEGPR